MSSTRAAVIALALLAAAVTAPPPALAYEVAAVVGGGSIQGKVTFAGPVATRKLVPTKDKAVCGEAREEPVIAVGPDKGVLGAVVYLKKVDKGKAWDKPAKAPEIVNQRCVFEPHVQVVPVGASVAVVNADDLMHNTHPYAGKIRAFNLALPIKGQRIEKPLGTAGLVRVGCDVHRWMEAWVYVADNPYYAVTKADGAFTFTEVPPGDYTLVAWQESTGAIEKPVT